MKNDLEYIEALYNTWQREKFSAQPSLKMRRSINNARKIALSNYIPNLIAEIRNFRLKKDREQTMLKVKKLEWKCTSKRLLNEGTEEERVTETWEAKSIFGVFKVYVAVGGGCFYKPCGYLGIEHAFGGSHTGGLVAKSPPRCKSIADGKRICQKIFEVKARELSKKCFE